MFLYNERSGRATSRVRPQGPDFLVTNARRHSQSARQSQAQFRSDDEGLLRVTSSMSKNSPRPLGVLRGTAAKMTRPKTAPSPSYRDAVKTSTRLRLTEYAKKHRLEICVTGVTSVSPRQGAEKQKSNRNDCVVLVKTDQGEQPDVRIEENNVSNYGCESDCPNVDKTLQTGHANDSDYQSSERKSEKPSQTAYSNHTGLYLKRAASADPRWRSTNKATRINALVSESTSDLETLSVASNSTSESLHHEFDGSYELHSQDWHSSQGRMSPLKNYPTSPRILRAQSARNATRNKNQRVGTPTPGKQSQNVNLSAKSSTRPVSAAVRFKDSSRGSDSSDSRPKSRPKSAPPTNNDDIKKMFRLADKILNGKAPVGFASLRIDTTHNGVVYGNTFSGNGAISKRAPTQTQRTSGKLMVGRTRINGFANKHVRINMDDFDGDQMFKDVDNVRGGRGYSGASNPRDAMANYHYDLSGNGRLASPRDIRSPTPHLARGRVMSSPRQGSADKRSRVSIKETSPEAIGLSKANYSHYYNHWCQNDPSMSTPPKKKPVVLPVHCVNCPCANSQGETGHSGCPPPPNSPDVLSEIGDSDIE
ncbi:uncharacterized protein [Ptychodera flava]|uniref:uncharacterized protein n=1 Tax=Ptychodera flava TaxID=63121 RepID=UPI00396A2622